MQHKIRLLLPLLFYFFYNLLILVLRRSANIRRPYSLGWLVCWRGNSCPAAHTPSRVAFCRAAAWGDLQKGPNTLW